MAIPTNGEGQEAAATVEEITAIELDGLTQDEEPAPQPEAAKPAPAKKEAPPAAPTAGRSEHELFVERKRTETTMRDTACKAICKIKHSLRQPGAQEDGRPVIPDKWDTLFKPTLGSYIKFLLSRPDQFRIVEGSGPGFYTIEDITLNKTVVAPAKGKDKGKGKGKEKGKFKGKDEKGKGWFDKGKGKFKGKGKGKFQEPEVEEIEDGPRDFASLKGKGKGKAAQPGEAPKGPTTKAAKLLAQAAREALVADGEPVVEDDSELKKEELEAAEDAIGTEGAVEEAAQPAFPPVPPSPEEVDDEAKDEDDEEGAPWPETKEEEDDDLVPKATNRGAFINLLFAGGVLGTKRPGTILVKDEDKRSR